MTIEAPVDAGGLFLRPPHRLSRRMGRHHFGETLSLTTSTPPPSPSDTSLLSDGEEGEGTTCRLSTSATMNGLAEVCGLLFSRGRNEDGDRRDEDIEGDLFGDARDARKIFGDARDGGRAEILPQRKDLGDARDGGRGGGGG